MTTVLLIDDDERLAEPLATFFERYDLQLINAVDPRQGLERLAEGGVDLIILDVMLPGQDGFDVCREIRKSSDLPIVMLTARGDVMDRVIGLELGADDYLAKPFEPRELVARVQNILRRSGQRGQYNDDPAASEQLLRFQDLQIDLQTRNVHRAGEALKLTTAEYNLLALLAATPGRAFSRDEILNHLRGIDADIYSRAVDILVSRLRQKLAPLRYIETVWGRGYLFAAAQATPDDADPIDSSTP